MPISSSLPPYFYFPPCLPTFLSPFLSASLSLSYKSPPVLVQPEPPASRLEPVRTVLARSEPASLTVIAAYWAHSGVRAIKCLHRALMGCLRRRVNAVALRPLPLFHLSFLYSNSTSTHFPLPSPLPFRISPIIPSFSSFLFTIPLLHLPSASLPLPSPHPFH